MALLFVIYFPKNNEKTIIAFNIAMYFCTNYYFVLLLNRYTLFFSRKAIASGNMTIKLDYKV